MLSLLPILVRPVKASDLEKIKLLTRSKFPDVRQMSTEGLARLLTNSPPPLLVDVRSEDEFRVSHLRNAVHTESVAEVKRLAGGGSPVVVYCAVGYRASLFARKLQKAGLTNVWNLEGSIFQWVNEDRPVYQGDRRVQRVHPYDRKWGQLLKADYRSKE